MRDDYYLYVTAQRVMAFKEAREARLAGKSIANLPRETLLRLEANDLQFISFRQLDSSFPGIAISDRLLKEASFLNKHWNLNHPDFLERCELVERELCQIFLDYSVSHSEPLLSDGWIWGNVRY